MKSVVKNGRLPNGIWTFEGTHIQPIWLIHGNKARRVDVDSHQYNMGFSDLVEWYKLDLKRYYEGNKERNVGDKYWDGGEYFYDSRG